MAFTDTLVVFFVSLLIGGLGIHLGSLLVTGESDYGSAVVTALLGAIVWGIAATLFGLIPLLGPVLVLLSYLFVIRVRTNASWLEAGGIALVAWVASLGVLYVLAATGWTSFGAVGVPGT